MQGRRSAIGVDGDVGLLLQIGPGVLLEVPGDAEFLEEVGYLPGIRAGAGGMQDQRLKVRHICCLLVGRCFDLERMYWVFGKFIVKRYVTMGSFIELWSAVTVLSA
jgi:hypothetical protein